MNIYDFDKTIYDGDSSIHFYFYIAVRFPIIFAYIPLQLWYGLMYLLHISDKTKLKEIMFKPLRHVKDIDSVLDKFWMQNCRRIKKWYLDQHMDSDIVISASPHFLLEPICKKLGIQTLIASNIDKNTGKYSGKNCFGAEKVCRLSEAGITEPIDNFYSDSLSDQPLAELAKNSYLVKGEKISPWPFA